MTTNRPGSVNQRPLYGCTSCYEEYSWPAADLRVYDNECWCDLCWWYERQGDHPEQLTWSDLEPYTPTLQAECERLTGALNQANEQAEHFEREWYLLGDECEKLRQHLMWLAHNLTTETGSALARHVLRRGGNGDLDDIQSFIDAAMNP